MADTPAKKPKWPQLPDGTTDWDTVFDHPENGLIPTVSKAKSSEALRAMGIVIIQKLFTRDNDKPEIERYSIALDTLIEKVESDDQVNIAIEAVARLLTQIKNERQELAREYLRKKALKKKGARRRKRKKKSNFGKVLLKALLVLTQPKVLIPTGIAGVIAIFAVVMFVVAPGVDERNASVEGQPSAPGAPGTAGPPAHGEAADTATAPQPEAATENDSGLWPRPVILRPSQWPMIKGADGADPVQYASLMYVHNAQAVSAVCEAYPRVKESLLVAFSSAKLGYRQPTTAELARIAATAIKLINRSLGPAVDSILIVPYGDPRFQATTMPPCKLLN